MIGTAILILIFGGAVTAFCNAGHWMTNLMLLCSPLIVVLSTRAAVLRRRIVRLEFALDPSVIVVHEARVLPFGIKSRVIKSDELETAVAMAGQKIALKMLDGRKCMFFSASTDESFELMGEIGALAIGLLPVHGKPSDSALPE
jgi:hypothetical protein